ncbi:cytochrome b5, partial [Saccharata proteae CBS 121410]
SSSSPSSAPGHLVLTDAQLARHDGSDPSIPLYIAINGTIYDVSSGRSFYGPGGPYAHFAGRDATRAWVTECFEGPEQWTHDMRGVHEMFMPKYMDETLEEAAAGKSADRRRVRDEEEAQKGVEKALKHWVDFFGGSGKYELVGKVERDQKAWEQAAPDPPKLCEKALKKKP